jgi:hypothetical protein
MDLNKLQALAELADQLENQGFIVEANNVHNLFLKQADQFNEKHLVELPMDVSDAVNNFDSKNYKVDPKGNWQDLMSIPDFIDNISDELTHAPADVDKNHIVFKNPKTDNIEVMNVVPREHWDTVHDPSKEDQEDQEDGKGFIKRALD